MVGECFFKTEIKTVEDFKEIKRLELVPHRTPPNNPIQSIGDLEFEDTVMGVV